MIHGSVILLGADGDTTIFHDTGSAYIFRVEAALAVETTGACPGEITFDITGASPGKQLALLMGSSGGSETIPGGRCGGTELGLGEARRIGVATADSNGNATVIREASPGVCALAVQAIDMGSCKTSTVVPLQ